MDGIGPVTMRLKALRQRAQPPLSVRKMAEALDVPPSTYAAYEDPAKFKKPILPLQLTQQIADVLTQRGIDKAEVLALAGLTGEFAALSGGRRSGSDDEWLTVKASVRAGTWKAQADWPAGEHYDVKFGPSEFPKEQRFAVRMEGLSMNKTILPNSDLESLWVKFSPIPPQPGDLVIVERHAHDLVETTCKRLAMDGDEYVLLSESTEPEFQEPIRIGKPDEDMFTDDEVRVVGIVLSAKLDLAPKGLGQRRYRDG
jgi:SOS-response transcriptional repressor LexA